MSLSSPLFALQQYLLDNLPLMVWEAAGKITGVLVPFSSSSTACLHEILPAKVQVTLSSHSLFSILLLSPPCKWKPWPELLARCLSTFASSWHAEVRTLSRFKSVLSFPHFTPVCPSTRCYWSVLRLLLQSSAYDPFAARCQSSLLTGPQFPVPLAAKILWCFISVMQISSIPPSFP